MSKYLWLPLCGLALLAAAPAWGQTRPYIGYVYPAGAQQGTTVQIKLGGQTLDGVEGALVTGPGVTAKVVEYFRKMSPQDTQLLREQSSQLKRSLKESRKKKDATTEALLAKIEKRMAMYVNRPACASISALVVAEVTVAADAAPGRRELRLVTPRGVSNPLVFEVGQVAEVARPAMKTCEVQVLGKEELAMRKRPPEEAEVRITLPCTVNGQIASGEVNRYRFEAKKGQRLVIAAQARSLIPYIADAVPGWFQPVLALYDANGKEVAYNDDYRFRPDPVILCEAPADGEYVFTVTDAIYRGREDFVYRVTVGELPYVTSIFPLGGQTGTEPTIDLAGWNLDGAKLLRPKAGPAVAEVAAQRGKIVSNRVPFAWDTLPETLDHEANDDAQSAQEVKLGTIVNGRIDRPGDRDLFKVSGRAGETIVAEVLARRLDSPLDSMLALVNAEGKPLAMNDDHQDAATGLNTHHADSYLTAELPADGDYFVHLADTARAGGEEYAYRLRISRPRPDFELRIVPSSAAMRGRGSATVSVYAIRKDGFAGDIKLSLKDPPKGISVKSVTLKPAQEMAKLSITSSGTTEGPVSLTIEGRATIGDEAIAREAVPAEDRMQAFLWRHLVPAEELTVLAYDASRDPVRNRVERKRETPPTPAPSTSTADTKPADATKPGEAAKPAEPPKFTKQQVAGRLRQLDLLYSEGLLTESFYDAKVAECEAVQ